MPTAIDQRLEAVLNRYLTNVPANLAQSIRYSFLSPGKRIRPRLALASSRMLNVSEDASLAAACALEMIHCFTLIHDDLPCMDNDDFRRGLPTNHKVHGEAVALLAGDGLLALAFEALADAAPATDPRAIIKASRRLARATGPSGVIGGQAAEALLGPGSKLEQILHVFALKTGALFEASMLVPLDLAPIAPSERHAQALEAFAKELGLAFQIADDLEDVAPATGKTADKPAGPASILYYLPFAEARDLGLKRLTASREALKSAWGDSSQGLTVFADEVLRKLQSTPSNS